MAYEPPVKRVNAAGSGLDVGGQSRPSFPRRTSLVCDMTSKQIADIIARIDRRKLELGIASDSELCRRAGMKIDFMNNMRRLREPKSLNLAAMARALDCSVDFLLGTAELSIAPPFDERRFLTAVETVARMVVDKTLFLDPPELAELALHLYNDSDARIDTPESWPSRVIGWLSDRIRRGP